LKLTEKQNTQVDENQPACFSRFKAELPACLGLAVAIAAVNRPVAAGLERYFRFSATLSADYRVHLPGCPVVSAATATISTTIARALGFPGSAAIGTTFRFILETTS
jgi:hypothetical protein